MSGLDALRAAYGDGEDDEKAEVIVISDDEEEEVGLPTGPPNPYWDQFPQLERHRIQIPIHENTGLMAWNPVNKSRLKKSVWHILVNSQVPAEYAPDVAARRLPYLPFNLTIGRKLQGATRELIREIRDSDNFLGVFFDGDNTQRTNFPRRQFIARISLANVGDIEVGENGSQGGRIHIHIVLEVYHYVKRLKLNLKTFGKLLRAKLNSDTETPGPWTDENITNINVWARLVPDQTFLLWFYGHEHAWGDFEAAIFGAMPWFNPATQELLETDPARYARIMNAYSGDDWKAPLQARGPFRVLE